MDGTTKPQAETTPAISFCTEDFSRAMALAGLAIPSKTTIPTALDLVDYGGRAALLGRNLDQELAVAIGNATKRAPMSLPPIAFKRFFKPGKSGADVFISANREDAITVELDGVTAQFAFTEAPEYGLPSFPEIDPVLSIERKTLNHALTLVSPAISTEETRYYLNGICVTPHPKDATALIFVATDGRRLVKHVVEGLTHRLAEPIIIPREAIGILRQLLDKSSGDAPVDLAIFPNCAVFATPEFYFKFRPIDGAFPDFERVIPANATLSAEIRAPSLRAFLRRAKACAGNSGAVGVQFVIDAKKNTIRLNWQSAELGTLTQRIDGHAQTSITIGFQIAYLLDVLRSVTAEHITLHCTPDFAELNPGAPFACGPALFASAGELRDPSTTIVIMPMRV